MQAESSPRIRELMAHGMREGRSGLTAGLLGVPEDEVSDRAVRTIGSLQLALMSGVLMQWTIDPDNAPTAHDIAAGLIALAGLIGESAD